MLATVNCPTPCNTAPAALTLKEEKQGHFFTSAIPHTARTVPQSPNKTPESRPRNKALNRTRKIPNNNAAGKEYWYKTAMVTIFANPNFTPGTGI